MTTHKIETVEDLKAHLYLAMQLEHATIPPYLTALYSIKHGSNMDAVKVLRVIAVEEMLHLTIAANLMRPLLLQVAKLIDHRPGALILSGLLDDEADEVAAAFAPLQEQRRLSDRGWTALLLS